MTLLFALTTAGLMLVVSAALLGLSAYTSRRAADRVLAMGLTRVRTELQEESGLKSPEEMVREENEILERADGVIFVLDPAGKVLAQSHRSGPRWPRRGNDGWKVESVQAPEGTVVIGIPMWKADSALRQQALLLLGLAVCVVVITTTGAWVLVGRTLRPIRQLAHQADAASVGSMDAHLKAPSDDAELVELVGTLNRLLANVTRTTAARGRFYAAASHELRTPLQALSGHLELALTRARSQEEYRAVIEEAHKQSRRFSHLVQELLLLNQLHQRTSRPPAEPTDLTEVLDRILFQLRGRLQENGLQLSCDFPRAAETEAPPSHVEIILRNLVENAAKYAAAESTVHLGLARVENVWRFEVNNHCSESLEVATEQLFEPFFRPDAARSSQTGGNGLGLAICKAVADANSWGLDWTREARGVRAAVSFPASAAVPPPPPAAREDLRCSATVPASP